MGNKPKAGFLNLSTVAFWTRSFFAVGVCPVHCSIISNIPGYCHLDVSGTPKL